MYHYNSIGEAIFQAENKKTRSNFRCYAFKLTLHWSTLPASCPASTINAGGLNFRIRNGNGCGPSALKHRDIKLMFNGILRNFLKEIPENQIVNNP